MVPASPTSELETECVVWCPRCQEVAFIVKRKEFSRGVYTHIREPNVKDGKRCQKCQGLLSRRG